MPMILGGTPPAANPKIRALGSRPCSLAASSEAIIRAQEPSLIPDELPAVTEPSSLKAERSFFKPSIVEPDRKCSSLSKIMLSPLRCGISTARISSAKSPLDWAASALFDF